ncbi:hypothetical protein IG631_13304 [Alternaria alternata]|nr:hypothetical protein IG631_13304 [Alternaria alternata]
MISHALNAEASGWLYRGQVITYRLEPHRLQFGNIMLPMLRALKGVLMCRTRTEHDEPLRSFSVWPEELGQQSSKNPFR